MSLESFITKVLNITDSELKALIYDTDADNKEVMKADADDILINKYAEKAKSHKDELTKKFDQGYQKAQKEVSEKYKTVLSEKLKFSTDKDDIAEIFDELAETIQKKSKSTLSDDQVKVHPVFTQREKELNDAIKKMQDDYAKEKDTIIADYKRKENLIKIKEKAEALLLSSGAVLSDDPMRRKNQINVFLNQFEGYDYDLNGDVPLILKEGQRLEDKIGNPVKFDDFISDKAKELFDFKVQDPKGNAGNNAGGSGNTFIFKDFADFTEKYNNEPDRGKRLEMNNAWEAMQKK